MAGGSHGNTDSKVENAITIHVDYHAALSVVGDQRVVAGQ